MASRGYYVHVSLIIPTQKLYCGFKCKISDDRLQKLLVHVVKDADLYIDPSRIL